MRSFHHVALALFALLIGACQTTPSANSTEAPDERTKVAALNTQLGVEYMRDGDNALALKKFEKALKIDPKYVDAHNALGLLYSRLQEFDKAEDHFKAALRQDPNNSLALNNYGQFLCHQKRYAEGQARFLEALKNPLYVTPEIAYLNAGLCALQSGDTANAEEHFRAALEKNPSLAPALLNMAQLSYDRTDYTGAQRYLSRYLEVADHTSRSLALGIRLERALGDKDKVASYSMTLRNMFPDSREAGQLIRGELN